MEYYSAKKRNEIVPLAAVWMDLDSIMLSEISQIEKDTYIIISVICGILQKQNKVKQKLIASEIRLVVITEEGGPLHGYG